MRFLKKRFCLRLRVVANSDAPADQRLKAQVRDALWPLVMAHPLAFGRMLSLARSMDPTARLRIGLLRFSGYRSPAIEVKLGFGAGHNWWGILYPQQPMGDGPVAMESWILGLLRRWGWIG